MHSCVRSNAFAAMQSKKGSKLAAVSTADGKQTSKLELQALPVLDGMAAAT